ncbi:MAG: TatD DNase family protein [Candidatus Tokpelaia sp. JSC085]|nr:MAG: TatD DNase family protein [Candidatus Tokpelaia sp. JSC085]
MLIDSHCHLDSAEFRSDLDWIIKRALSNNVQRMITISTCIWQFDRIRAIAEKYKDIFCSVGTHPHNVDAVLAVTAESLIKLAEHPKVVAIGETGLDYHYNNSMPHIQKRDFFAHIEAARQSGLPVIIHSRDADEDMVKILRHENKKGDFTFVLHCYNSGMELALTGIELGGYLSFSGILTFKSASHVRRVAKIVPQNQILVETDAPYLAPVPYRGQRNEPSFMIKTVEILARTLDMPYERVAEITTLNALRVFCKMMAPPTG